jgi:hypothetical protein
MTRRFVLALIAVALLAASVLAQPAAQARATVSDTRRILGFAQAHGLGLMSIWAIQRDNGGCPGTIDSNSCSGIKQPAWAFSHLLEPVTGFF